MNFFLAFIIGITLLGCKGDDDTNDPIACTEEFVYGLQVTVLDAGSNEAIVEGITVVAEAEDYEETLEIFTDVYLGAGERVGTYTLTVFGDGYTSQVVGPIAVPLTEDECHVIPQQVTITLESI